ncbi:MAG: twin-arginine translocase TatA/TatE family subunit [Candidatus Omnitrophica bacterium]|nr:twin-arginine translocase TatA/TatE family subunit [bacterium]MBW7939543.1 twin-arginine translocase TatA/TatE family subunit [Candidatus Omnitrophota bacterium]MCC6731865.1 twin-arginine translocase TatA/TatE family subunit [Candidatus Omnitrophota bacterium]MCK6497547.1 twin-arginine translocase TatA/TatE family subunit [bacterium]MCL4733742.1 twin-arginine translocase TatA/TatE family subunit [Candidatus Omnitrophota bacterium]
MFNMNPVEMIIIGVIALVVVGPRGLPEIGRMVGKWMRTFREAADEMKRGLNFEEDYRPTSTYKRLPPSTPAADTPATATEPVPVAAENQESAETTSEDKKPEPASVSRSAISPAAFETDD